MQAGARAPHSAAAAAGPGDDSPRARPPACGARSGLPGATVLGAEDRPGSAAAAAGSKCGSETGRERAEALRDRRRRVLAAQAPAGYLSVTYRRGDKNIRPPPKDGEGQEARHGPCAASINK